LGQRGKAGFGRFSDADRDSDSLSFSPKQILALDRCVNRRRPSLRFEPRLESAFGRANRTHSAGVRLLLTLLPILLFGTAPIWGPTLMDVPKSLTAPLRIIEFAVIVPLFSLASYFQWRWPQWAVSERLMVLAASVQTACLFWMMVLGRAHGFAIDPLIPICAPLILITFCQPRLSQSLFVLVIYLIAAVISTHLMPRDDTNADVMERVVEGVLLLIAAGSALVGDQFRRRSWAARQLLAVQAYADPLTGLANRRAFEDHYELVQRVCQRERKQMYLALIDLDHFKRVNDSMGHDFGDGVLVEVSLVLAHYARRPLDLAARLGGEEFVLLLHDCEGRVGDTRVRALIQQIEALHIAYGADDSSQVTASAGGTAVDAQMRLADAYRKADNLLYESKRLGRNRATVDGDEKKPVAVLAGSV
jgi:diguanylate cyclase (GGDEF)-like protein